jgi:WD40 repeat protein
MTASKFLLIVATSLLPLPNPVFSQKAADEPIGPIMSLPGHTGAVMCMAFSPNGKFVATHGGLGDHSFHLWDVTKRKQVYQVGDDECGGLAVVWAADGRLVLSGGDGGRGAGSVILRDPLSGKRVGGVITHEHVVRGVALSPNGKQFAAADWKGLVLIRDFKSGAPLREFAHGTTVNAVAFSADGQWLISGGDDKKLRLWNVDKDRLERTLEGHNGAISCVAFAKEGKSAFSATYSMTGDTDNTIRVWDVATGKEIAKLDVGGETRQLTTAAFSSDGRRALTGHENGEVCLWDLTAKTKLRTFREHKHAISAVAFSPDGRYALSGENNQGGSAMWLYRLP